MAQDGILDLAVVGGGACGLATAHFARKAGRRVAVFEAADRPGGKIGTTVEDGFVLERGPQGWLDKEPAVMEVCRDLGLEPLESRAAAAERYVLRGGRLIPLPMSPMAFLRSPILTWRGKLRLLSEVFRKPRRDGADESIWEFGCRRVGEEATRHLLDAVVAGIFAGDIRRLSLRACFPVLAELEEEYGALFKGMAARRKQPSAPVSGRLYSFPGGMEELVQALARSLGDAFHSGTEVDGLHREEDAWTLVRGGAALVRARRVALTTPVAVTARILAAEVPGLQPLAREMPQSSLVVVTAVFPRERAPGVPQGYGFVAPRCEGFRPLGVQFIHEVFAGHTPPGLVQLRIMLGGAMDPDAVHLDDGAAVAAALDPLRPLFDLRGDPERTWVFRAKDCITQYNVGHLLRVAGIEAEVATRPGLLLGGDSLYGLGVNPAFARGKLLGTGSGD